MSYRRTSSGLWLPPTVVPFLGMAGNLVQVGSSDGKVRVKNNGRVVAGASDPCCCTVPPCSQCAGTQQCANVTQTSVPHTCFDCSGNYTFSRFIDGGVSRCQWVWVKDGLAINLFYCRATRTYCAAVGAVYGEFGGSDCGCKSEFPGLVKQVTGITCADGVLSGTFVIPGIQYNSVDCRTASVTVTLNVPCPNCACTSTPGSATVVATGPAGPNFTGVFPFRAFSPGSNCYWQWGGNGSTFGPSITVMNCSGSWLALDYFGGVGVYYGAAFHPCLSAGAFGDKFASIASSAFSCSGGKLTGSFVLQAVGAAGPGSATVTF